jgi:hypothetical protein
MKHMLLHTNGIWIEAKVPAVHIMYIWYFGGAKFEQDRNKITLANHNDARHYWLVER